jgi:hypothetical protein
MMKTGLSVMLAIVSLQFVLMDVLAQSKSAAPGYSIFSGNTHAHTAYTWSHGEQLDKSNCKGILVFEGSAMADTPAVWTSGYVSDKACPAIIVINGSQYPGPQMVVKTDWKKVQGIPAVHFALAKENGYDFYVATDHSQEYIFNPPSAENKSWLAARQVALSITDSNFVALEGFEYSENDGKNGRGHINVINSNGYVNALMAGIDLPEFYQWLDTAAANGSGPVVASFNHPDAHQYNDWAYRDPKVTNIITLLEVINSNKNIHYEGFVSALDKGWKVSPVCGNDNHGLSGIKNHTSRTFVLAEAKTKTAILNAMKNRRTYASLEKNLQCRYTVNGKIMGSELGGANTFQFDISISDPDTNDDADRITKIDIVKDNGQVVTTSRFKPSFSVNWRPVIHDTKNSYFFVRVWNAGGGDAPGGDADKPVAWLAPVWISR